MVQLLVNLFVLFVLALEDFYCCVGISFVLLELRLELQEVALDLLFEEEALVQVGLELGGFEKGEEVADDESEAFCHFVVVLFDVFFVLSALVVVEEVDVDDDDFPEFDVEFIFVGEVYFRIMLVDTLQFLID